MPASVRQVRFTMVRNGYCVFTKIWGVHSTGSLQARRAKPSFALSLTSKAQPSLHHG
jgi:hypothetical protein